jgi:tetratricopeptide (TPR) repeat protein
MVLWRSIWLVLWRSIWFRYAAYGVARAVGEARRWLVSGWRPHAIGLAAVGGAGMWFDYKQPGKQPGTFDAWTFVTWTFVAEVAVVYGLLWLIVHAYRSSGRFVVLTTVNHAGKDFDSFAAGLAAHLANDLRLLSELYKTIDDANPPPQRDEGFSTLKVISTLKVGVDNPGDALASVVGEKSDVKLGLVSVSLRPLIAAFERSIPTQRLSTSLHRTGNQLTLLADIAGAEGNWRVERNLPAHASAENTASILREMAKELVYRVFTTNVPTGSKEWEAVERFSEGLRAYRCTLITDMDSKINLREAERHFFDALRVDKTFARCSYNLGIVYRDLKKMVNARAAFERAIQDNPAHADAAYALSLIHMDANRLLRALEFADRAIAHSPRHVLAWTLKGYIWRQLQTVHTEQAEQNREQPEQKAKTEKTEQSKQAEKLNKAKLKNAAAWRANLRCHETAAALAWRDLCCAAWRARPLDTPRQSVERPFYFLAEAHLELNNRRRGVRILRQAIRRRPTADLYFQLGKGLMAPEKVSRAHLIRRLTAYQAAVRLARTRYGRAFVHVFVAETSALLKVREAEQSLRNILVELFIPGRQSERVTTARHTALQACDNALASPSIFTVPSTLDFPSGKDMLSKLQTVCRKLQDVHRCRVIERIEETLDTVEPKLGETDSKQLERITQAVENGALRMSEAPAMVPIIAWKRAVFFYRIGFLLRDDRQAERRLRHAVSRLERHYPAEDWLLGSAYERLAGAKRLQSKFSDALKFAEKAVALDPFSASKMKELSLAYWGLANYDQAEQHLRRSFALNPSDAEILHIFGQIALSRGLELTKREDRRAEWAKGIKTLGQAIDLAEDDKYRAQLHFWSAAFHSSLMEYDPAKKQYQMARALGHFPSECYLYLGDNYIEQELYESAERHLRNALQEILKAKRTALPKARPESSTNWWRRPQNSAFGEGVPPGYFLLRVCLSLALVAAERGRDVARARRKLGFVERHMKFLGKPQPTAKRDELDDFENLRLEIAARYEDYLGWVCHLDNQPRQARQHLEASVKKRADSENLYHLARVYLDQSAIDRAEKCCRRARAADMLGVYSTRIAKIEAEVNRRRNADAESPRAAVEGDPREASDAENR